MPRELRFVIKNGKVECDAVGFEGNTCHEHLKKFMEQLGNVEGNIKAKPEAALVNQEQTQKAHI